MEKCILVCGGLASLGGVVEGGIVQGLDVVVVVDVLCLGFHHVGGCTVADLQTLPRMLGVGMRGSISKGIRAIRAMNAASYLYICLHITPIAAP